MGNLVAKKYPTKLFLDAADHTYVECGNGAKGWSCWGGKTGGTAFNSGPGSTKRADCIAKPDERAGITCYLVNGVCHQAANRILLPAGILVSAARGYAVSSAIFGPYGKMGFWPCAAPFDQCRGVSGDLPECMAARSRARMPKIALVKGENWHLRAIKVAYNKFDMEATPLESMRFQVDLFEKEVKFRLGENLGAAGRGLRLAKESVEFEHMRLAQSFALENMGPVEYIKSFNEMTLKFQDELASAISEDQYGRLLGMTRGEKVVLADPDIIDSLYGEGTANEVYGKR